MFPALDMDAEILFLIGRDELALQKFLKSRNGPTHAPGAQRLEPGWVVLRNACLDSAQNPSETSCFRAQVLNKGRPSLQQPCTNRF